MLSPKDIERFFTKFQQGDGCWEWKCGLTDKGYGQFWVKPQNILAHRVAYILEYGPIPEGMHVCHHCDNRKCVKPTHLFLGDNQANVTDKVTKGRQLTGENHPMAKLTLDEVKQIRAAEGSQRQIAKRFGVTQATVSDILLRKIWV